MSQHPALANLLSANAQWAEDVERLESGFFAQSAKGQSPHTLWIGCADSRVPESVITGSRPGDIFVSRNAGNQVQLHDDNVIAALAYAVDYVGVEHVVVCGHTECGAAAASLGASGSYVSGQPTVTVGDDADSPLNRWLAPLTRLAAGLELSSVPAKDGLPILVRENIKVQVDNVCSSDTIKKAWANGKSPMGKEVWVHGWVYDLSKGKLQDLGISRGPNSK